MVYFYPPILGPKILRKNLSQEGFGISITALGNKTGPNFSFYSKYGQGPNIQRKTEPISQNRPANIIRTLPIWHSKIFKLLKSTRKIFL